MEMQAVAPGKCVLGIDIGGTAVKLGVVDATGKVTANAEASVSFDGYKTPILETVLRVATSFLQAQSPETRASLVGIGVSATGQIDSHRGVVAGTGGNFPGWKGTEIVAELANAFHLPVTVANDANCMCLGEAWVGAAAGYTDVIGITIGTGLGGGILAGGQLLEGARGLGGELGHLIIHAGDGVLCGCGQRGCWEKYAATTALVRRAKALDPTLADGRAIFAQAAAGNAALLALLDSWLEDVAAGLIGLVHVFNPQIILIGGGVSGQQALLIDPLAAKIRAGVMPAFAQGLEIRAAALQNNAGLVGAAAYFWAHTPA
ncbi:MAG: ROK family protein [Gemmiger sp.]|nr:ROK family protein [Gemmiger sp.]